MIPPQYSNAKKRRPDAGFNRRFHQGSYRERQKLNQLPWQQRVEQMTLYDVDDAELYWLSVCDMGQNLYFSSFCLNICDTLAADFSILLTSK